jgi:hypothetical protein
MSYRHTLEATIENLHEIEDLIRRFPENGGIPSIEIDLVMQKLRNIYELMLIMQNRPPVILSNKETPDILLMENSEKIAKAVLVEKKPDDEPVSSTLTIKEEPLKEHLPDVQKTESIPTTKKIKAEKTVQTLADQFMGRPTLLESLHETYNNEVRTITRNKPVNDLMSAIGINDRYTFIRELFNNDSKAFESAIVNLNNAPDYNNACEFLSGKFEWDMDSEPVQQLLEIVRRKYV